MKILKVITLVIITLFSISVSAYSQSRVGNKLINDSGDTTERSQMKYNRLEVSMLFGMQNYYGDFAGNNFFPGGSKSGVFNWNAGLKLKYNLNQYFGYQLGFSFGKMSSAKEESRSYFNGNTLDFDIGLFVNMTTLLNPYKYNKKWYWDIYVTLGGNRFNTEAYNKSDLSIGKYDKLIGNVGVGTSLQYRLSEHLDIGLDFRINHTGSDLLDAVPKGRNNDSYGHISLIVSYSFGKNSQAYKWNPENDEHMELWEALEDNMKADEIVALQVDELKANQKTDSIELLDDDLDGVPNVFDLSPNTQKETFVNFQGIPIPLPDSSRVVDKISDNQDNVIGSIFFDYDSSAISMIEYRDLARIALFMKENKESHVLVVGHTDMIGSSEYNIELSKKRSEEVIKALIIGFGIDAFRFEVVAKGKMESLSNMYSAANRRVDVILKK